MATPEEVLQLAALKTVRDTLARGDLAEEVQFQGRRTRFSKTDLGIVNAEIARLEAVCDPASTIAFASRRLFPQY